MIDIHPSHPYRRLFKPAILHLRDDLWRVKWRTFDTIKQDADFSTLAAAQAFAARLPERVRYTHMDEDQGPEDYQLCDTFWRELYEETQHQQ